MRIRNFKSIINVSVALLFSAVSLLHAVPNLINYQGQILVDGSGYSGNGQVKFALVNATGDATYWSNDGTSVDGSEPTASVALTVTGGVFNVLLGEASVMTALPTTVFSENDDVKLRVWFDDGVNGSQQLAPDTTIAAVGYALKASSAESANSVPNGAITGAMIAGGTITTSQLANGIVLPQNPIAGNSQVAEANTSYQATSFFPTAIDLSTTQASVGDVVQVTGVGAGGWTLSNAITWVARDSNRLWISVASSADGNKLVAAALNGNLYTSTDSGETWTARESSRSWRAVASSTDGTNLVAAASGGAIYTSTDSGVTWTARPAAGNRSWELVTSSADGSKLVALGSGTQIYTSDDFGVTWTARESSRDWRGGLASSADGTKLVAAQVHGKIYISSDSGVTWTPKESDRDWRRVASSADGTKLVAVARNENIFTSTDSGVTWAQQPASGDHEWYSVASSADGTKLVAGTGSAKIYTSSNSGVTWTAHESNRPWWSVASSADGEKLVAGVWNNKIYTSPPGIHDLTSLSGGQGDTATVQYLGNDQWRAVSEPLGAGAVQTANIANDAVTSAAILDGSIAAADLDTSSIGIWSVDGGNVFRSNGSVGIGATNPAAKLDVNGAIRLADNAATETAGMIRWNGTDFEGYDGSGWRSLTEAPVIYWAGGPSAAHDGTPVNTWIPLPLDTIETNTASSHFTVAANGNVTFLKAGIYEIELNALRHSADATKQMQFVKGGQAFRKNTHSISGGGQYDDHLKSLHPFQVGEVFRAELKTSNSTTTDSNWFLYSNTDGYSTRLQIRYLGPLPPSP